MSYEWDVQPFVIIKKIYICNYNYNTKKQNICGLTTVLNPQVRKGMH